MSIVINGDAIAMGQECFVIAEAGINHNGSLDIAHAMIDAASRAGCNAIKFQKRTVDVVYTQAELAAPRESVFGGTNGDLKRGLEFSVEQYGGLAAHARRIGIAWGASVWDAFAVSDLMSCGISPDFLKIASPTVTNIDVLKACAAVKSEHGIPVIMSTGMSTLDEINRAIDVLGHERVILMHCVSAYPAEPVHLNLRIMDTLMCQFGVPVGYSGHEEGIEASVAAAALGACCIERHFTLSRFMWGSDQPISLEPAEIEHLVDRVSSVEVMRGSYDKALLDCELPAKKKLRR